MTLYLVTMPNGEYEYDVLEDEIEFGTQCAFDSFVSRYADKLTCRGDRVTFKKIVNTRPDTIVLNGDFGCYTNVEMPMCGFDATCTYDNKKKYRAISQYETHTVKDRKCHLFIRTMVLTG